MRARRWSRPAGRRIIVHVSRLRAGMSSRSQWRWATDGDSPQGPARTLHIIKNPNVELKNRQIPTFERFGVRFYFFSGTFLWPTFSSPIPSLSARHGGQRSTSQPISVRRLRPKRISRFRCAKKKWGVSVDFLARGLRANLKM